MWESTLLVGGSAQSPSVVSGSAWPVVRPLCFARTCVFVCIYPLRGIGLATCTCELTRFSICQNNNFIETHLCFPYRTSCLSRNALHLGLMICEIKFPFAVFRHQYPLLILSGHIDHPRSKKHRRDILKCSSSRSYDSGLYRKP